MFPQVITDKILELGKLSLLFARVNRATFHEDGITPESDTDHTVMLGLSVCSFASACMSHLDIGKVAQFAFVHDLVEAYAGDTNSLGMSGDVQIIKEERERAAFLKIKEQFKDSLPWVHTTIEAYESLESEEAKFVKAFDKIMPKVTQFLNGGIQFKASGRSREDLEMIHQKQLNAMSKGYAKDLPETLTLLSEMMKRAESVV